MFSYYVDQFGEMTKTESAV